MIDLDRGLTAYTRPLPMIIQQGTTVYEIITLNVKVVFRGGATFFDINQFVFEYRSQARNLEEQE